MSGWLKDVKDADKVALLLLGVGLLVMVLSTCFTVFIVFHIKDETILDRVLVAIAGLSSQGGGLITAAMGILRLQSKADSPPVVDKVTSTVQQQAPETPKV